MKQAKRLRGLVSAVTLMALFAAVLTVALSACGGGDAASLVPEVPDTPGTPQPPPMDLGAHKTPAGSAVCAMTQAVIGPAGGTLDSADGLVALTVPAGAFGSATTVSIQPIDNNAHDGLGNAYCIQPEGVQTTVLSKTPVHRPPAQCCEPTGHW